MSGGPINISIASDTRQFQSGIDDVADALQKVTTELDDATTAGDKAGSSIQEAMEKAQQGTQQTAETVQQGATSWGSYGKAAQEASERTQTVGTATRKVGDDLEESGHKISAGSTVAEGAVQNLAYSAGTIGEAFTGPGGALDSLGQFAAFLGPSLSAIPGVGLGLAAVTSLAGIGLSLLGQQIQNTGQEAQTSSPAVKDFVKAFQDGTAPVDAFDSAIRQWAQDADDFGGLPLKDFADDVQLVGVNFKDVAEAITSKSIPAMADQEKILAAIQKKNEDLANSGNLYAKQTQQFGDVAQAAQKLNTALGTQINNVKLANEVDRINATQMGLTLTQYHNYSAALDEAKTKNVALTTSQKDQVESAAVAGVSTKALKGDVDDYAAKLAEAKTDQDNWNSTVSSTFSSAATDADDYFKGQQVNWDTEQTNLQEVTTAYEQFPAAISKLTTDGLNAAGAAFAESNFTPAQMEEVLKLPPAEQQKIVSQWNTAGKQAKTGLQDGINAGDLGVTVPVKADTSGAKLTIDELNSKYSKELGGSQITLTPTVDSKKAEKDLDDVSKPRKAKVTADANVDVAKKTLDNLAKPRKAKVTPDVNLTQAQRDLNNFLTNGGRGYSVSVTVNQRPGTRQP